MAPLTMRLPRKKTYEPPSKRARDNYYARKTVDEVFKARPKTAPAEETLNEARLRSRYERRLELTLRSLQAIQALPNRQSTDRLLQTEQAIRAALHIEHERRRKERVERAESGRITERNPGQPNAMSSDSNSFGRLKPSMVDSTAGIGVIQAPFTPTICDAPTSPPPAPRKPKK